MVPYLVLATCYLEPATCYFLASIKPGNITTCLSPVKARVGPPGCSERLSAVTVLSIIKTFAPI